MSQCCNMCWSSFFGHNDRLFDCQLLLEGIGWQVAQFGVQPHAVVEAHDVVGDVCHGLGVVGVARCQTRSVLRLRKKRSITALSQQLPLRLMLPTKPWRASSA